MTKKLRKGEVEVTYKMSVVFDISEFADAVVGAHEATNRVVRKLMQEEPSRSDLERPAEGLRVTAMSSAVRTVHADGVVPCTARVTVTVPVYKTYVGEVRFDGGRAPEEGRRAIAQGQALREYVHWLPQSEDPCEDEAQVECVYIAEAT